MDKKRLNYYLRGTGIILVIWVVILVSCYGVANNANANVRKIFYICFFSVMGASLIGYWVYAFLYEKKQNKEGK